MKTAYGFTRFDNLNEFKSWIQKQPKYNYTGLQVHHTALPDYSCFYKTNGKTEDELTRQQSMKSFHTKTNGWSDIAQHFTVFPNGKIVTGRALSKTTAIGIKGWNSNKICVEIYGNFDKDVMTKEQKEAVICLYGELCKKFNLTPSTSTIRCHAWFTAGGTYLGDYVAGRSAKTCPGTKFMGFGNKKSAFEKNFIPLIKEYMSKGSVKVDGASAPSQPVTDETPNSRPSYTPGTYKVNTDSLNVRKGAGTSFAVAGSIKKDEVHAVTEVKFNGGTPWGKLESGLGWISLIYTKVVQATATPRAGFKQYIVRVTANNLNGRKEASASSDIVQKLEKDIAVTIVEEKMNGTTKWGKTKSGYWIALAYTQFVKYV